MFFSLFWQVFMLVVAPTVVRTPVTSWVIRSSIFVLSHTYDLLFAYCHPQTTLACYDFYVIHDGGCAT